MRPIRNLATEVMATYDQSKAHALFLQIAQSNTWQVPTLVWTQANSRIDDPSLESDPRLKYVPSAVRKEWDPVKLRQTVSPEELAGLKTEAARHVELVKAMHSAGVQFMAGTDGPDPYVFPGFSLHDELEWLVKSGFTPLQALQAATFNPALFLTKGDKYGVAEIGRVADLVLLDANPAGRHPQHPQDFRSRFGRQVLFSRRAGQNAATSRDSRRPAVTRLHKLNIS